MTPTSCKGSTMRPRPVPTTLALALLSILAGRPALPQDAAPETAAPAQAPARTLDTVLVTRTRVRDRTVAESQSPIDKIGRAHVSTTVTYSHLLSRLLLLTQNNT